MSTPMQGGQALASFRVLGFPVHVHWSFFLFVGLLGWRPGVGWQELGIWLALAFVAVLVHELGHAVAARRIGARPEIAIVALGGVTTYQPPRPLSRLTSLGISLAGPAVGLLFGGVLLVVSRNVDLDPFGLARYTLDTALFTTLGWSVLNLLPIVPLDGGQAMRELLPGNPAVRGRRASVISIVLAVGLAFLALTDPRFSQFALLFAAFLVLLNVMALRSAPATDTGEPGRAGPGAFGTEPIGGRRGATALGGTPGRRPRPARAQPAGRAPRSGSARRRAGDHRPARAGVRAPPPGVGPASGGRARDRPHRSGPPAARGVPGHRAPAHRSLGGGRASGDRRPRHRVGAGGR